MRISLPWPPRELSPNCSIVWGKKMKFKKDYRDRCKARANDCFWVCAPEEGNIHIKLTFYPPNKRPFDLDNMLARMKSGLDGIADSWNINDVRFRPITIDMGEPDPDKLGKVILEII